MSLYFLYFIAGQVVWGLLPVFWKMLAALDPVYLLSVRIIFSALVCGVVAFGFGNWQKHRHFLSDKALLKRLAIASVFITSNWGLYIFAVNTGHIFEASLAYFINPIICLLFSALIFHEALNGLQKASAVVAAAGIVTAFLLYGDVPWLSLLMCFPFSVYSVIKKKVNVPGMVSVFLESLAMTIPSALYVLWMDSQGAGASSALSGWEYLLLPMTGVLTAIPMALFSAGLRGIPFSAASILMYLSPAIQIFLALFYGETLSPIMLINFAFVLVAVLLYSIGTIRRV